MMKHPSHASPPGATASPIQIDGRVRVVLERLQPAIDGGRFPIKRTPGEMVSVAVDMLADGHDLIAGVLKYRRAGQVLWSEIPLTPIGNDGWAATFPLAEIGEYEYTVEGWIDRFGSWLKGLLAKHEAGQDVASELLEGAQLAEEAAGRARNATEKHA